MKFPRKRNDDDKASYSAIQDAEENLRAIRAQGPEVSKVSKEAKQLRVHNHFGEQLTELIVNRHKKEGRAQ